MPDISDQTPREDYTIAGETFKVFQPYAEGHVLTKGEASSMNQTYAENIRNNFASKVKEAKEANAFDLQTFQGKLDDYMSEYEFGVRSGGGTRGDPVRTEAMNMARDKVREALRAQNIDLKSVGAEQITSLAKDVLDTYPQITELAKQKVDAQKATLGSIDLSKLNLGGPAPAEEAPKGKKAAASAEA